MADQSSPIPPNPTPSRTNRPMSEALLNEKVCDAPYHYRRAQRESHLSGQLTQMCSTVGPLPKYPPHPKYTRRIVRHHLLGTSIQTTIMASIHRARVRCWKSVGGMR